MKQFWALAYNNQLDKGEPKRLSATKEAEIETEINSLPN